MAMPVLIVRRRMARAAPAEAVRAVLSLLPDFPLRIIAWDVLRFSR
jgi:hypothetical protein